MADCIGLDQEEFDNVCAEVETCFNFPEAKNVGEYLDSQGWSAAEFSGEQRIVLRQLFKRSWN